MAAMDRESLYKVIGTVEQTLNFNIRAENAK